MSGFSSSSFFFLGLHTLHFDAVLHLLCMNTLSERPGPDLLVPGVW